MDQFLLAIHQWMTGGLLVALVGSFLWGMVSVLFSPCHLASIPLIVGYVGGQDESSPSRRAAWYAVLFTFGLFLTIAMVGIVCALLGRMLGDVGPWWTIIVGLILLWVALDMLGVATCSMSGSLMGRLRLKGLSGAFGLGLAYGVLSGSCTFGFIAPILAVITIQERFAAGVLLIVVFGIGHCLPIVMAGSSTAWVKGLLARSTFHQASRRFRQLAGVLIGLLGVYFIANPFLA
jgi:cytochrome c-type biogenesis protein